MKDGELAAARSSVSQSEKKCEGLKQLSNRANDSSKRLEGQVHQMSDQIRRLETTNRWNATSNHYIQSIHDIC